MSERINGTIKQGEMIICADVELTITTTKMTGGLEKRGGSFHVPEGGHIVTGESYQLHLPDGRWGQIVIHTWQAE